MRKMRGESVKLDMYTSELGAKDWMKSGCFLQFLDRYLPL
jgi:hypothetical protein